MDRDVRMERSARAERAGGHHAAQPGVGVENELRDVGPETVFANITAFNKWVEEDWGWNYQDAIFSSAMLSLVDIDMAVAELERVLKQGARIVHLMPAPVMGRSPADPHFDPFWARCEEAGIPVAFHVGNGGMEEMYSVHWGENPRPPSSPHVGFSAGDQFYGTPGRRYGGGADHAQSVWPFSQVAGGVDRKWLGLGWRRC